MEKTTLKNQLHNFIKAREGQSVPYDMVMLITRRMGHKTRTAERMLNKSRSPEVETLYNSKHQISSYRWAGELTGRNWWDNSIYKKKSVPNKLF